MKDVSLFTSYCNLKLLLHIVLHKSRLNLKTGLSFLTISVSTEVLNERPVIKK